MGKERRSSLTSIATMTESLSLRGTMKGHSDWVTCISTTLEQSDVLLSSSRDKTIIMWTLEGSENFGTPRKSLTGHSHYVQDIAISSDGQFCLSGSWDGTLRLGDLNNGTTTRRFVSHEKDVLSVAFSADNRQILGVARQDGEAVEHTRRVQVHYPGGRPHRV